MGDALETRQPPKRGNKMPRVKASSAARAAPVDRAPGRGKYDRNHTPEERAREQRRRLFAAMAHVFATRGYANSTVDDVVGEAGVSRRTFYEHFEDLHDGLIKLHEASGNKAFRTVEAYCKAQQHPNEQLRAGVEGMLGLIAHFPEVSRVLF